MCLFFKMNLADNIYCIPKMDIVFLRNVLIYFDAPTKQELIEKMHGHIRPQGYLFLGHSESLINISSDFKLVGQTIYRRKD